MQRAEHEEQESEKGLLVAICKVIMGVGEHCPRCGCDVNPLEQVRCPRCGYCVRCH